jgi:hypothetical protein
VIKTHTLYQQADERRKKKIAVYKTIRYYHEKKNWSIQWMCSFFKIARASYYKWTHRKVTDREKRDAQILEVIQAVAEANNGLFGANDIKRHPYFRQNRKYSQIKYKQDGRELTRNWSNYLPSFMIVHI